MLTICSPMIAAFFPFNLVVRPKMAANDIILNSRMIALCSFEKSNWYKHMNLFWGSLKTWNFTYFGWRMFPIYLLRLGKLNCLDTNLVFLRVGSLKTQKRLKIAQICYFSNLKNWELFFMAPKIIFENQW